MGFGAALVMGEGLPRSATRRWPQTAQCCCVSKGHGGERLGTRENVELDEIQNRLAAISEDNGVPYGRVHELFDTEKKYGLQATRFRGYLSLSDAFKSVFLETAESFNSKIVPHIKSPLSEYHAIFFPRLFCAWQSICGFDRLALHGSSSSKAAIISVTL
jgi:hypothetical protein